MILFRYPLRLPALAGLFLLSTFPLSAQEDAPLPGSGVYAPPASVPAPAAPGSPHLDESAGERFRWAAAELVGSNLAVWSFDLIALRAEYARINPRTWEANFNEGFTWDNSDFFTNQILHPYQGGMYFNAARANGFGFWPSALFSASGSLMWEFLMESEYPSINDFITTSFGGAALGESSFRLSSALLYRKPAGVRGLLRELAADAMNPVGAANRWLFDRPGPAGFPSRPDYFNVDVKTGVAYSGGALPDLTREVSGYLGFRLQYGDPYYGRDAYAPYDYFSFDLDVIANPDTPTLDVFGQAALYGRELYLGGGSRALVGFFQHFDYLQNRVYEFAANGAGLGALYRCAFGDEATLELRAHAYAIALGGVDSSYSEEMEGRYYSLGPGGAFKFALVFSWGQDLRFAALYNHYAFRTLSGADGANQVSIFSTEAEFAFSEVLRLGASLEYYDRWSDVGVDSTTANGVRFYLVYSL